VALAIVDASPLYAVADADDKNHQRCLELIQRIDLDLIVPSMVVAEVTYLIGSRLGADAEAAFLDGLSAFEVESPTPDDWPTMATLVRRYADFPLGGTDASIAVLADRLRADYIVTLDKRHFGALRSSTGKGFALLPE
jgi:predicted nucleic acid-binding protein